MRKPGTGKMDGGLFHPDSIQSTRGSCVLVDQSYRTALPPFFGLVLGTSSFLDLGHEVLKIHLSLNGGAVGNSTPAPNVLLFWVGTGGEKSAQDEQVSVAAGEMEGGVAVNVGILDGRLGTAGHICEENLENSIVTADAGLHNSVFAPDITT